jgi:hypothetical protein
MQAAVGQVSKAAVAAEQRKLGKMQAQLTNLQVIH